MKNKLFCSLSTLTLSLLFASSQALACGCIVVVPPPPPPPVVHNFVDTCNSCNREGARHHERCWQIPQQRDGQIVSYRRVCE